MSDRLKETLAQASDRKRQIDAMAGGAVSVAGVDGRQENVRRRDRSTSHGDDVENSSRRLLGFSCRLDTDNLVTVTFAAAQAQ